MNIAHVNVRIMARPGARVPWHGLIPVFHRWIRQETLPEILIDVADYAHVPDGPGIMIIGHDAFYSVDNRQGRPGLLYNRRTPAVGTPEQQMRQAFESALRAARTLENEPECKGDLAFDEGDFEVFVNDRLLAPNTRETYEALEPALRAAFPEALLTWDPDPRGLFRVGVRKKKARQKKSWVDSGSDSLPSE